MVKVLKQAIQELSIDTKEARMVIKDF